MDWTEDTTHRSKTLRVGSATVIIRRPKLSDAEYKYRETLAKSALEAYARSTAKTARE